MQYKLNTCFFLTELPNREPQHNLPSCLTSKLFDSRPDKGHQFTPKAVVDMEGSPPESILQNHENILLAESLRESNPDMESHSEDSKGEHKEKEQASSSKDEDIGAEMSKMNIQEKEQASSSKDGDIGAEISKMNIQKLSTPAQPDSTTEWAKIIPVKKWWTGRWSNPGEWNFHIIWKRENLNGSGVSSMLGKLMGSGQVPQNSTQLEDHDLLKKEMLPGEMQILWISHATLLIRMKDINILTDPVFSDFAGPITLGFERGYKRYRQPAINIEDMKKAGVQIHAVIISHNHYDHFDYKSIIALNKAYNNINWFVPKDLENTLTSWGCTRQNIKECTWWETGKFKEFEFHFTPAKHWSGRGIHDWYTTLWGSWVIKGQGLTFFFAGDTGYQEELFQAIKKKFPVIDVAALPIGAYKPREMLKCQHINPDEAVKIHKMLRVKRSIGIHWGTFQLGIETIEETLDDLEKAMVSQEVEKQSFHTLEESLIRTYHEGKFLEEEDGLFKTD